MRTYFSLVFLILTTIQVFADTPPLRTTIYNPDKLIYLNGPDLTLAQPPVSGVKSIDCPSGLNNSTHYYYEYKYAEGYNVYDPQTNTYTLTPNTVGVFYVTEIWSKWGRCRANLTAAARGIVGVTAITVVDFKFTPAALSICLNDQEVKLDNYITYSDGVTYSGEGVYGKTFDPKVAGVGTHTITASRTFDNGVKNITLTITVKTIPTFTFNLPSGICKDGTSLNLSTYINGASGATFSGPGVSNGLFNPASVSGQTFSTIMAAVTTNGCTVTDSKTITIVEPFVVNAGINQTVCDYEIETQLTGAVPTGGTWSGTGVVNGRFRTPGLTPGQYTVKYTVNREGCIKESSKYVILNGTPEINIGKDTIVCNNALPFQLKATPAGGTWAGSGVNGDFYNASSAGVGTNSISYTVTVSGCGNTASKNVFINAVPANTTITGNKQVCVGDKLTLIANATGINLQYHWFKEGLNTPFFVGQTLEYSVSGNEKIYSLAKNENNCLSNQRTEIPITVSNVTASAGPDQSVCSNSAQLTLTGGTPNGGIWTGIGVTDGNFIPTNLPIGAYTVTYTVSDGGCEKSSNKTIFINGAPEITIEADTAICQNALPFQLKAKPNGGIWTGAGVNGDIYSASSANIGTNTITYTVGIGGCISSKNRIMQINPVAGNTIITGNRAVCLGENLTLIANATGSNLDYYWYKEGMNIPFDTGQVLALKIDAIENLYSAAVTSNGCLSNQKTEIIIKAAGFNGYIESSKIKANRGEPIQFYLRSQDNSNVGEIVWNFGDETTSKEMNPYHYYYDLGKMDISVKITNNNCVTILNNPEMIEITGQPLDIVTSIKEFKEFQGGVLNVYPTLLNGSDVFVELELEGSEVITMNLIKANGEIYHTISEVGHSGLNTFVHQISEPGLYLLQIISGIHGKTFKIIKN